MVALVRHNAPIAAPRGVNLNIVGRGDVCQAERFYAALDFDHIGAWRHPRTARPLAAGHRKIAEKLPKPGVPVALAAGSGK